MKRLVIKTRRLLNKTPRFLERIFKRANNVQMPGYNNEKM
jgi:hypothetical protein